MNLYKSSWAWGYMLNFLTGWPTSTRLSNISTNLLFSIKDVMLKGHSATDIMSYCSTSYAVAGRLTDQLSWANEHKMFNNTNYVPL